MTRSNTGGIVQDPTANIVQTNKRIVAVVGNVSNHIAILKVAADLERVGLLVLIDIVQLVQYCNYDDVHVTSSGFADNVRMARIDIIDILYVVTDDQELSKTIQEDVDYALATGKTVKTINSERMGDYVRK